MLEGQAAVLAALHRTGANNTDLWLARCCQLQFSSCWRGRLQYWQLSIFGSPVWQSLGIEKKNQKDKKTVFYHYARIVRKPLISIVLWLFNDFFLSLKNDVNAALRIQDVYPGSWFLPIPDPGPRIQKQQQKRGWKKICCHNYLCSHKFHKIANYFSFEVLKKKIWANFQKNYRTFYPKNCH